MLHNVQLSIPNLPRSTTGLEKMQKVTNKQTNKQQNCIKGQCKRTGWARMHVYIFIYLFVLVIVVGVVFVVVVVVLTE